MAPLRMSTRILFIFLTLLFAVPGKALIAQDTTPITGRVVDRKSGDAIPFATIRLMTHQGVFGVVSNLDGDFQIPTQFKARVDTIKISCIGYLTKTLLMRELNETQLNIIKLEESIQELPEMVLNAKTPERITPLKIMRSAIKNIPDNYPTSPYSYIGYYRDYQLNENKYINLNEAIIETYDSGFNTIDNATTKLGLYYYKRNDKFENDVSKLMAYDNSNGTKFIPGAYLSPLGGNELAILRLHDAIRNYKTFSYSYVNVLGKDFINNHYFTLIDTVYLHKTPLYHLSFRSKYATTGAAHFAKGDIYIELGNFAIHKFEYFVFERGDSQAKLLYHIQLEYARSGPVMYLNYISFNNIFKIRNSQDFKVNDILLDRGKNAFVFTFNNKLEKKSAVNIHNYKLEYDGSPLKIDRIEMSDSDANQVYVYLKGNVIAFANKENIGKKFHPDFKGIVDMEGREINKATYVDVYQFRELFVQKMTNENAAGDSLCVNKNEPLSPKAVRVKPGIDISNYWINSPLEKE
jgi:hypothetical protein